MIDVVKNLYGRKRLLIIVLVLLLGLLGFLLKAVNGDEKTSIQASNSTTVQVQQVKLVESSSSLSLKANLEPVEEAVLSSQISGQVIKILCEEGDKVSQGQALVYLDDRNLQNQLQSARISLQKLETTLDTAQRSYDRSKALFDNGAASKTNLEDAETELKMAKANVQAQQATIEGINISLNNSIIRAPISGEVADKDISLGQYVSPGAALAKIMETSTIKAAVQLKQSDLETVKTGQKVTLKLSKDDSSGYEGIVKSIASSADSSARVFDCQVQVDNKEGKLHSGVFGYIEIPNENKRQILSLPLTALTGSEGDYSVFTVEDNIVRKRSVSIGEIQSNMAEVLSGLNSGENVIVTNLNTLQDGELIQIEGQGV